MAYPYPQYFERTYVNPSGNIAASGYYMSYIIQEIANKYPTWHAIRDNIDSVGQQFISPFARILHKLDRNMSEDLNNNFISLAPVDEVDVLYRMKIPSTISFLNNPNIECWTAPSGATPSGSPFPEPAGANPDTFNQIQVAPVTDLEEFYYYLIPTRIKTFNEESFTDSRADGMGVTFPIKPSGILDPIQKYVDRAKKEHDIIWAHGEWSMNTECPTGDLTPILKYSMNDNASSTLVRDSMGTYDGTFSGGKNTEDVSTENVSGWDAKIGNAFVFDGTTDYIDVGDNLKTIFKSSFSISIWINATEGRTDPFPLGDMFSIVSSFKHAGGIPLDGVELRQNQEGKIYTYYRTSVGPASQGETANAVLPSGKTGWFHLVWVVDDATNMMYLYVNGELKPWGTIWDGSMTQTMSDYDNDFNIYVGARNWGGTEQVFFDGALDSLMIFSSALNQEQVSAIFENSNPISGTGAKTFYKNDKDSMGTYEEYTAGASGYPMGFTLYKDYVWWVGCVPPSGYFLNLSNSHPPADSEYLDHLASYDITNLITPGESPPSGLAVDEEGTLWIINEDRQILYAVTPMYDYFLVDKENRYIFFREDYSDPGVFVKPA